MQPAPRTYQNRKRDTFANIQHGNSLTFDSMCRPEYDSTVGTAARFQIEYNGKQPGDPAKAAQVILKVAEMDEPPLRLLLGSDAVGIVEKADLRKAESDKKWRHLSTSTDFLPGT